MIYDVESFDYSRIRMAGVQRAGRGRKHKSRKRQYVNLLTAFDTETTTIQIDGEPQGLMYIWQWAFGQDVLIGRTWEEYRLALERIKAELPADTWLVVWVHNLSYDWHYLRGVVEFGEVFATASRTILRADAEGWMELRCSYLHSGYSLDEWLKALNVPDTKLTMDYSVKRFPWTPLTQDEIDYCCHDVLGVVEAIQIELARDGDTLATIPPTSTGYIRRELKRALAEQVPRARMLEMQPDWGCYQLLREAFRGGNTHASRYYSGRIIRDVGHVDRSSSYPDVLCHHRYPVGRWQHVTKGTLEDIARNLQSGYAMVIRLRLWGVKLKHPLLTGCPYIPVAKCTLLCNPRERQEDNGRILEARFLDITVTDIDLKIILDQYTVELAEVKEYYKSKYGLLPDAVTEILKHHYEIKTQLKGVAGREAEYAHSKSVLNSAYGCMAQDPGKPVILYSEDYFDLFELDPSRSRQQMVEAQRGKGFCPYSWGVWCTAWARYELQVLIDHVGLDFIYCDTDSIFYANPEKHDDWSWYNGKKTRTAQASGACAQDPKGIWHYMGSLEPEPRCKRFATLGAKKYCEIDSEGKLAGKLVITIAGLSKERGAMELGWIGGMRRFCAAADRPMTFRCSDKLASIYNDRTDCTYVDGEHVLHIGPNVCLVPTTYTLGITNDYHLLLETVQQLEVQYNVIDKDLLPVVY